MQVEAQAIVTPVHYHHIWIIWILFLVGDGLHVLLQVNSLATVSKISKMVVLRSIWIPVAFRTFASAMIFGLIWQHPDLISQIGGIFGHPLSSDENSVFTIPMNNMIAGLYGLFLDSVLGYIPVLKSQLPDVTVTQVKQTTTATVTQTTETSQVPAPKVDAPK